MKSTRLLFTILSADDWKYWSMSRSLKEYETTNNMVRFQIQSLWWDVVWWGLLGKFYRGKRGHFCGMGILGLFEVYSILACIDSQGFIRYYKELEEELFYQISLCVTYPCLKPRADGKQMDGQNVRMEYVEHRQWSVACGHFSVESTTSLSHLHHRAALDKKSTTRRGHNSNSVHR